MAKPKDVRISFRAPAKLRDLVREFVLRNIYMNESDFYREATRQKIQREAPELYKRLLSQERAHGWGKL